MKYQHLVRAFNDRNNKSHPLGKFKTYGSGAAYTKPVFPKNIGTIGCMSEFAANNPTRPFIGPRGARKDEWTGETVASGCASISPLMFKKFVRFIAGLHPKAAECVSQYPPSQAHPNLYCGSDVGYLNYMLAVSWRFLWASPLFVYCANYLRDNGFDSIESLIILHAAEGIWREGSHYPSDGVLRPVGRYKSNLYYLLKEIEKIPHYGNYGFYAEVAGDNDLSLQEALKSYCKSWDISLFSDLPMLRSFVERYKQK